MRIICQLYKIFTCAKVFRLTDSEFSDLVMGDKLRLDVELTGLLVRLERGDPFL